MRALFYQFIRFSFVGAICFLIDFCLYTLCNYIGVPYLISGVIGFSVSVIVNYILSMRYVFKGRDDISVRTEFVVFVILSVIGLGINEFLLYLCIDQFYMKSIWIQEIMSQRVVEMLAKIFATAVVTVYNFVTRKLLLEQKKKAKRKDEIN